MTKKKTAKKKAKKSTVKTESTRSSIKSSDHTEKAAEVKELKKAIVEGRDTVILINIFSPDSEPKEFKFRIPKIVNTCPPPHRKTGYIAGILLSALKRKYGQKVQ